MKIVAIIQARMGSTRLPGKTLAELAGRSMLAQVIERVGLAETLDRLVVATSTLPADDPIERECDRLGAACFRGSEDDVLDRFAAAAALHRADAVVRVTADCPLIDPEVIDYVVGEFEKGDWDYASNTLRRTYPRGLDTEIFTAAAMETARREASEPYQRVHVTPFFYEQPHRFRLLALTCEGDYSGYRWTVDTPEDLALVRAICARLGGRRTSSWRDALRVVSESPELAATNQHVRQKLLLEG